MRKRLGALETGRILWQQGLEGKEAELERSAEKTGLKQSQRGAFDRVRVVRSDGFVLGKGRGESDRGWRRCERARA